MSTKQRRQSLVVTEINREIRMDAELWATSGILLYKGQNDENGCVHQFRASLIFTAFAFEAYLNHIGAIIFDDWNNRFERNNPLCKLTMICKKLEIETNYSCRPMQSIKKLFQFRNILAHGKDGREEHTVKMRVDKFNRLLESNSIMQMYKANWEGYSTEIDAVQAREDVFAIANNIHNAANIENHMLPFLFGIESRFSRLESDK